MTTPDTYFNNGQDETSLIGAILQHNEVLDRHKITRDLFYEGAYQDIFDEILKIRASGSTADLPSVARALPKHAVLISTCTNYLVSDIKGLVQRLRDCVQARGVHKVIEALSGMQSDLRPAEEVVEEATKRIIQLSEVRDVSYRSLIEVATDTIKEIDARRKCPTDYSGVESGIEPLDRMTDGFQDGDYIILGARPSVGKTALALTLAFNAAMKKESVGFMSLEMKDTALFKRVLAAQSGLSMQAIRTGLLGPKGMNDLINGCSKIANTKVFFADVPNMSKSDLIAESRILKSREDIGILFVDYLGLVTQPGDSPRWEKFSDISQALKSLARELKIPVVVLSQLTRPSDGKRPVLADLRETGSLEQDADVVLFLHPKEASSDKKNDQKQLVELIVAKQRQGETGIIDIMFDKARMQFSTDTSGGPDKEPRQPYKD